MEIWCFDGMQTKWTRQRWKSIEKLWKREDREKETNEEQMKMKRKRNNAHNPWTVSKGASIKQAIDLNYETLGNKRKQMFQPSAPFESHPNDTIRFAFKIQDV